MRKKRPSRRSVNLPAASITTSLPAKQAAIWAMQMALGNIHGDLLAQDTERFIQITEPYFRWTPAAFKRFFYYYDCPDEQRAPFEQLTPQEAWIRLTEDLEYEVVQAFRAFRKFHNSTLHRVLEGSLKALEQEITGMPDPV